MNEKIKKHEDNKSNVLASKKNMNKNWEDKLSEWMIEEFFTPYQAS